MTFTYTDFLVDFPEFNAQETALITRLITQIIIETNAYVGLGDNADYGIKLHVAHYLYSMDLLMTQSNYINGARVNKIESRNEKIEFAPDTSNFASSPYGIRLQNLINNTYGGGGFFG